MVSVSYKCQDKRFQMSQQPNYLAGAGAGRTPEFIEMKQVGHGCWSGSARLVGR